MRRGAATGARGDALRGGRGGCRRQGQGQGRRPMVTAVLKIDMHCNGCAHRIRASVRHFPVMGSSQRNEMNAILAQDSEETRRFGTSSQRSGVEIVTGSSDTSVPLYRSSVR